MTSEELTKKIDLLASQQNQLDISNTLKPVLMEISNKIIPAEVIEVSASLESGTESDLTADEKKKIIDAIKEGKLIILQKGSVSVVVLNQIYDSQSGITILNFYSVADEAIVEWSLT